MRGIVSLRRGSIHVYVQYMSVGLYLNPHVHIFARTQLVFTFTVCKYPSVCVSVCLSLCVYVCLCVSESMFLCVAVQS